MFLRCHKARLMVAEEKALYLRMDSDAKLFDAGAGKLVLQFLR
jgi:hypothetical protein